MGTLTSKLTLSGSAADYGVAVGLSISKALTIQKPFVGISKEVVTTTGGDHIVIPSTDARRFIYIKHTGVDLSGAVTTADLNIEFADNTRLGVLKTGEFLWFPLDDTSGATAVQLEAGSGTIVAEYSYYTVAS
jgi:hypothetical protein